MRGKWVKIIAVGATPAGVRRVGVENWPMKARRVCAVVAVIFTKEVTAIQNCFVCVQNRQLWKRFDLGTVLELTRLPVRHTYVREAFELP